jgi:hypothetical protein
VLPSGIPTSADPQYEATLKSEMALKRKRRRGADGGEAHGEADGAPGGSAGGGRGGTARGGRGGARGVRGSARGGAREGAPPTSKKQKVAEKAVEVKVSATPEALPVSALHTKVKGGNFGQKKAEALSKYSDGKWKDCLALTKAEAEELDMAATSVTPSIAPHTLQAIVAQLTEQFTHKASSDDSEGEGVDDDEDDEEDFDVERILEEDIRDGVRYFLIRWLPRLIQSLHSPCTLSMQSSHCAVCTVSGTGWLGYDEEDDTWEPETNVDQLVIDEWKKQPAV